MILTLYENVNDTATLCPQMNWNCPDFIIESEIIGTNVKVVDSTEHLCSGTSQYFL